MVMDNSRKKVFFSSSSPKYLPIFFFRMNLYVLLLALISVAFADELSDCKCLEGYRPDKTPEGVVMCYGIFNKALAPCNLVQRPRCKCGPEVTGILSDASGVWCVKNVRGKQIKRWQCENREEWEDFYRHHPEQSAGSPH